MGEEREREITQAVAKGVRQYTSNIEVAGRNRWPDAAVLDMADYAEALACHVQMPSFSKF